MSMPYGKFLAAAFALYLPNCFATAIDSHNGWFFGAEIGGALPQLKNSTTVFNGSTQPAPNNVDLYSINEPGSTPNYSLYFGYHFVRLSQSFPYFNLALRYQHLNSFKVKGTVEQYSLPAFVNYNYSLNAYSNVYGLFGKLALYQFHRLAPYISAGIGLAQNRTNNYTEQATSGVTPRTSPDYSGAYLDNLMYSLGIGLDFQINRQVSASLGYEFSNLGKIKMGHGNGDFWQGQTLSLGTLKTNAILLSINYLFLSS